jgi:cleavage and polyadenylation specificity factor subunit 2
MASALAVEAAEVAVFLTPLFAQTQRAACYVLDVDDCRILLDCGWTEAFDNNVVQQLQAIAATIDVVALSHATLEHSGALPVLMAKLKCKGAVLSTRPVHRMGQLCAEAACHSKLRDPSFEAFNAEDVVAAFQWSQYGGHFNQLRFLEEKAIKGVTLSPLLASHSLGGSAWRISKGAEVIVYVTGLNHRSERHLSKAHIEAVVRQPSALILDVSCAGECC